MQSRIKKWFETQERVGAIRLTTVTAILSILAVASLASLAIIAFANIQLGNVS